MTDAELVIGALEQVAERRGDPADVIYARLFERYSQYEDMFVMDKDGGVRANMLKTCFTCIIGMAEGKDTPRLQIEASRLHHDGYGLSSEDLDNIFIVIRDTVRDCLAGDWTIAQEAAWTKVLDELSAVSASSV